MKRLVKLLGFLPNLLGFLPDLIWNASGRENGEGVFRDNSCMSVCGVLLCRMSHSAATWSSWLWIWGKPFNFYNYEYLNLWTSSLPLQVSRRQVEAHFEDETEFELWSHFSLESTRILIGVKSILNLSLNLKLKLKLKLEMNFETSLILSSGSKLKIKLKLRPF